MKTLKIQITVFIFFAFISAKEAIGQKIEYIKVPELEKMLNSKENKLLVINLWATWCAPCVKELPAFEKVAGEYEQSKVRFIMISLDFPSQIESQLKPFLRKNKITLDISVMMDTDYNSWIDKVDPQWQGNIPSTLIVNNGKKSRYFHSGEIDEPELRALINKYL
jgi:thiol-disulfide isomerase/thioredoxin